MIMLGIKKHVILFFCRYHHNIHKTAEEKIIRALEARGVETKKCQRMDYTNELIDWADIIFTTGKDYHLLCFRAKKMVDQL